MENILFSYLHTFVFSSSQKTGLRVDFTYLYQQYSYIHVCVMRLWQQCSDRASTPATAADLIKSYSLYISALITGQKPTNYINHINMYEYDQSGRAQIRCHLGLYPIANANRQSLQLQVADISVRQFNYP